MGVRSQSRSLAEPAPSASSLRLRSGQAGQALSEKQKQILRCAQNDSEGLGMTELGQVGTRERGRPL